MENFGKWQSNTVNYNKIFILSKVNKNNTYNINNDNNNNQSKNLSP